MQNSETPSVVTFNEMAEKRLNSAWRAILNGNGNLLDKSKNDAIREGEGMSIFKFLRPSNYSGERGYDQQHNCEYYYAEKGSVPFEVFTREMQTFHKIFNPKTMFAICVSVPEFDLGESTVQEIRFFNFVDNKEIN